MTDRLESLGFTAEGRRPVAAVLRIGHREGAHPHDRKRRGAPTARDAFEVASVALDEVEFESGSGKRYKAAARPLHPAFAAFNDRPAVERRRFSGVLVYPALERTVEVRRVAPELPKHPQHPTRRATCYSDDGETAQRLMQFDQRDDGATLETWEKIDCPGPLCEYAQAGRCKSRTWLYFLAHEDGCPPTLIRFYSGGEKTTQKEIAAFFEYVREMATNLKLDPDTLSLAGIPFVLQLETVTGPGKRYPMVRMVPDGRLEHALAARRADAELAGGHVEARLLEAAPEDSDTEESRAEDIVDVEPCAVPRQEDLDL